MVTSVSSHRLLVNRRPRSRWRFQRSGTWRFLPRSLGQGRSLHRTVQGNTVQGNTVQGSTVQGNSPATPSPWDNTDRDRLLRQQSLFAAQRGQFAQAIAGFNLLINRNPDSATDYNNRGLVYAQQGNWDAALQDYNEAIHLNPDLAHVFNNRANYYAAQGDLFAALSDYQTALELDANNIRAWVNQGITFRELEMFSAAIDNFNQSLWLVQQECDSTEQVLLSAHVHAERGRTHHLFGDWNCALSDYYLALDYLSHESQPTAYPPLWWQVEGWLNEILQAHQGDGVTG